MIVCENGAVYYCSSSDKSDSHSYMPVDNRLVSTLKEQGVEPAKTIGFTDAEFDIALLEGVGLAVAVGNAVEPLKQIADIVTDGRYDQGVIEVIEVPLAGLTEQVNV
ncbi:MAG: HAD hydrolase family protein [Candidatus Obscuribacterales bacterium]|nr:HAD hydrolase family protein [Candidatus Obscuribacterales bacterium]